METLKGLSFPKGQTGVGVSCHLFQQPGGPGFKDIKNTWRRCARVLPALLALWALQVLGRCKQKGLGHLVD